MNKPPFKRGSGSATQQPMASVEENFDPIKEFADDDTAYDIQYYTNAIFALKGSKEELKYPYLISGYLNCCPVDKDLKGLSPIHIAQSYLMKDLQPILGRKTRDYFETILVETDSDTTITTSLAFSLLLAFLGLSSKVDPCKNSLVRKSGKELDFPNLFVRKNHQ